VREHHKLTLLAAPEDLHGADAVEVRHAEPGRCERRGEALTIGSGDGQHELRTAARADRESALFVLPLNSRLDELQALDRMIKFEVIDLGQLALPDRELDCRRVGVVSFRRAKFSYLGGAKETPVVETHQQLAGAVLTAQQDRDINPAGPVGEGPGQDVPGLSVPDGNRASGGQTAHVDVPLVGDLATEIGGRVSEPD
jgi:hypothetical protein